MAADQQSPRMFTRREIVKLVGGTLALFVGWALLFLGAWEYVRWTEDFFPGHRPRRFSKPMHGRSPTNR